MLLPTLIGLRVHDYCSVCIYLPLRIHSPPPLLHKKVLHMLEKGYIMGPPIMTERFWLAFFSKKMIL